MLLEAYVKILNIEASSMLEITHRGVVPAVISYKRDVLKSMSGLGTAGTKLERGLHERLGKLSDKLADDITALETAQTKADESLAPIGLATYFKENVIPAMNALRDTVDTLETLVDETYWPLPSYGDILYSVK
jgi:glutamine synthetase